MSEIAQWEKPKLSLSQIINMSVGFFGIQFGFDLQKANVAGSLNILVPRLMRSLFFACRAINGLLVQPIIGYMSDRTWHPKFGRRRPFFLLALIFSNRSCF
ncbi:MAG: hypothetical protein IPP81_18015 [Chitinophagaceae bacterium]|nr:hypothetical protein [Chitinophagaceae bacterium]